MTNWHLRLRIVRYGINYGIAQETFASTLRLFLHEDKTYNFSVGSDSQDYIIDNGLAPSHLILRIANKTLTLVSQEALEVFAPASAVGKEKGIGLEKIPLGMSGTLSLSMANSLEWKMVFPNQTILMGKLFRVKESLGEEVRKTLEMEYGLAEQIQESSVCLIYKTKTQGVLKILRPSLMDVQQKVALRFLNAARKFQTFRTPLFLKIHNIVYRRDLNLCFITTPYFEGETLQNWIARRGIFLLSEAEPIIKAIAERLFALQNYASCFRNLVPDNILVAKDGEIALTGFFLAKSDVSMTGELDQMVRPGYTAPEQIHKPSSVNISADIYSLGAIFYNMLLGEAPLQTDNTMEYIQKVSQMKPIQAPDIQKIHARLPEKTCALLASMLSLEKNARPSPWQVLSALSPIPLSPMKLQSTGKTRHTEVNVVARNLPDTGEKKIKRIKTKLSEYDLNRLKRSLENGEKELTLKNFDFIERLTILALCSQDEPEKDSREEFRSILKTALWVFFTLVFVILAFLVLQDLL